MIDRISDSSDGVTLQEAKLRSPHFSFLFDAVYRNEAPSDAVKASAVEQVVREAEASAVFPTCSEEEREIALRVWKYALTHDLDNKKLDAICGPMYSLELIPSRIRKYGEGLISNEPIADGKTLSFHDKIRILTDTNLFSNVRIRIVENDGSRSSSDLGNWGNRFLFGEGGYAGMSRSILRALCSKVQRVQQHDPETPFRVLDIGCGRGLALQDVHKILSNAVLTGITASPEPAMAQGVSYYFRAPELMPAAFFESMDVVVSNRAFEYFAFPEIALRNGLLSLRVGGVIDIDYSYENSAFNLLGDDLTDFLSKKDSTSIKGRRASATKEAVRRTQEEFALIRKLAAGPDSIFEIFSLPDQEEPYVGRVSIQKKRSITPEKYIRMLKMETENG